jgi:hypothetical protein
VVIDSPRNLLLVAVVVQLLELIRFSPIGQKHQISVLRGKNSKEMTLDLEAAAQPSHALQAVD